MGSEAPTGNQSIWIDPNGTPNPEDLVKYEDLKDYAKFSELANVAGSGSYNDLLDKPDIYSIAQEVVDDKVYSYNDLTDKPTIPSTAGLASEAWVEGKGYLTNQDLTGYAKKADIPTVSKVGKSNDYNDLDNKPTIPTVEGLASEEYVARAIAEAQLGGEVDLSAYALKTEIRTDAQINSLIEAYINALNGDGGGY